MVEIEMCKAPLADDKSLAFFKSSFSMGGRIASDSQGIVGCTPTNVPLWEIPI